MVQVFENWPAAVGFYRIYSCNKAEAVWVVVLVADGQPVAVGCDLYAPQPKQEQLQQSGSQR
ncbi:hypothetical protein [Serratia fonticola]|uniref:hypothetical protein n=1 Tax=Serratia fonticola TaxID=47917 RepID=UPI00192CFA5A|nr:hypothetical protein [Serratia fonticola]MBL5825403.1 hypothetical protein [Serratia fonticola]